MKQIKNTKSDIGHYYREKGLRGHKRLVDTLGNEPERTTWPEALLIAHALTCRESEQNPRHAWDIEHLALTTPWEELFWDALSNEDDDTASVCLDYCDDKVHSRARVTLGRMFG